MLELHLIDAGIEAAEFLPVRNEALIGPGSAIGMKERGEPPCPDCV
jgi:hypothetical protein